MTNTNNVLDTSSNNIKSYETAVIKKLPGSKVEITGSISTQIWSKHRTHAIKNINQSITIPGFRKGMVPENILIAKIGDMAILEEMAELTLSKVYINILTDNKIDAVGKPEIRITKLAKDNPLEFIAITSVVPEIDLPNYKKIATIELKKEEKGELKVLEKDIEEAILKIRKQHASQHGHDHDKMTPLEHEKALATSMPELTDDFVKTLGEFDNVPDFRNKLSDMILDQKREDAREKLRIKIIDKIAEDTKIEMPEIMIDVELNRTQSQFAADIEKMGIKMDDYLKHAKKTIDEVRKEWRPHAEKKAKLQLILNKISILENIKPDPKEVEEEVGHIIEHYKDADHESAAVYAQTVLTNEKVFQWLEKQGE